MARWLQVSGLILYDPLKQLFLQFYPCHNSRHLGCPISDSSAAQQVHCIYEILSLPSNVNTPLAYLWAQVLQAHKLEVSQQTIRAMLLLFKL